MIKGFGLMRLPLGFSVRSSTGPRLSQAFFPTLVAGGFLGQYLGDIRDYVHFYAMREHGFGRAFGVFFLGVAVGAGVGYAFYPHYAPKLEELLEWLNAKIAGAKEPEEKTE